MFCEVGFFPRIHLQVQKRIIAGGYFNLTVRSSFTPNASSRGSSMMSLMVPLVPLAMSASVERLKRIIAFIPIAIWIRSASFFVSFSFIPAMKWRMLLVGSGDLIF
jgi:hypothetical protein